MKKGLIFALVIAVALICLNGYSYAPVLKAIPDIIVGDTEEGNANNIFRFSDAFAFDSYVTDQDSTISELKWSYMKTGGTYTYQINDKGESSDITFVAPSAATNLRNGATTASFRNETLSTTGAPSPYAEPTFTGIDATKNVYLALYVSDGTFKDSQEITVYTSNNTPGDGLSAGVTPFKTEDYAAANGWNTFVGAAINTTYGDWNGGRLRVKWPSTAAFPTPGWAQTLHGTAGIINDITAIPANSLYILRVNMSSDQATNPPAVRVRVAHDAFAWTAMDNYGFLNSGTPPTGGFPGLTAKDFDVIVKPQGSAVGGSAYIAFDNWSGGISGNVFIEGWKLYRINESDLTGVATEANVTSFSAWASSQATGVAIAAANITFTTPGTSGWQNAAGYVTLANPIAAGNVYRISYYLAKSGTAKATQIRLRANDARNGASDSEYVFDDAWATTNNLTTTAQPYTIYRTATNPRDAAGDFAVWCDGLASTGTATRILNRVLIEKVTLPQLN